jgi:hypothetical protein
VLVAVASRERVAEPAVELVAALFAEVRDQRLLEIILPAVRDLRDARLEARARRIAESRRAKVRTTRWMRASIDSDRCTVNSVLCR